MGFICYWLLTFYHLFIILKVKDAKVITVDYSSITGDFEH